MDISSEDDVKDVKPQKPKDPPLSIQRYDAQMALAFHLDCEEFLQKFSAKGSLSYTAFAHLWTSTNFSLIFKDHDYILMLKSFVQNAFYAIKKFLFDLDPYKQTGALYLLYGVYYKQPVKQWVKVRLTHLETDQINQMLALHRSERFYDTTFVHTKMKLDHAFVYCALGEPLGIEGKFINRQDLCNEEIYRQSAENPLEEFTDLVTNKLDEIDKTESEYKRLMAKYKTKCPKLGLFDSDPLSSVVDQLKSVHGRVVSNSLHQEEDESEVRATRSRVRRKAGVAKNAVYRCDRKVLTGVDLARKTKSE